MKKLLIALVLFCSIGLFAQVDTQGETKYFANGSKIIYFYMSGMADSSETYYTNWYDIADYWAERNTSVAVETQSPYSAFIERSSANDTAEVYVIIEGRMGTDGTNDNSDAYDVDTLGTYNLELDEWVNFNMNDWKPMQIRVQLTGTATNRIDAIVRGWLVFKRPNVAVQVPR